MMIVGSLSACFFTSVSLFTDDHCLILDIKEQNDSVAGVPMLYPEQLVPILNTCLFSEAKNAAADLGIETQMYSMTNLETTSKEFQAVSTDLNWDPAVWNDYSEKLWNWAKNPSLLAFVDDDSSGLTQPAEQLA